MPTCSPTTCSSSTAALSGLIDFYFAATDVLAYDVAVCLNAWCFEPDISLNVTKARLLLVAAYDAVRPLDRRPSARRVACACAQGAALAVHCSPAFTTGSHTPAGAFVTRKDPARILCAGSGFTGSARDEAAYGL